MASRKVSVREMLDASKFTPYQAWVCVLCFLAVVLDGFDLTIIGVTLPKIKESLNASSGALGIAVGAGLIGPLVGAIFLGMSADRWGRKRTLWISALIFGVFTLLTAFITSVEQLAVCRFLAGIGLGGAIPNALAFGCEYAPSRLRASLSTAMWAGMPGGSVIGSLFAAYLLSGYGWQSLFFVGGILPIIVALVVALLLPESLEFLVRRGTGTGQIRKIVSRISPTLAADPEVEFYSNERKLPGMPVKHLFTRGFALTTILLWVLFFIAFYFLWILLAWAPTFLRQSGASPQQYSIGYACIHLGAFVACLIIGRLMDTFNPFRTLTIAFVIAFLSMVAFGLFSGGSFLAVALVCVLAGAFINGANGGLVGLCTFSYPVDVRGTGVGWAYAIGKVGSLFGPVVGGYLIDMKWSVSEICIWNSFVGLILAGGIIILHQHIKAVSAQRSEVSDEAVSEAVA